MSKGLIIPPGDFRFSHSSIDYKGPLPPETLRNWLVFWDEFRVVQGNPFIYKMTNDDMDYLKSVGIATEVQIQLGNYFTTDELRFSLSVAQEAAYQASQEEPGKWTVARTDEYFVPANSPESRSCIVFELVNALQIPDKLVSFDDILNFKQKRASELEALHAKLEDVYLKIDASHDIPRGKCHEIDKLEVAIKEFNAVSEESFARRSLSNLRIQIDRSWVDSIALGLAGGTAAATFGLPMLSAGATIAAATFGVKSVFASLEKNKPLPLTYVTSISKHL